MQLNKLPTVAVIADAHLHDIYSDYDGASTTINGESLTLRSWVDTRRSSRVFNESRMAFIASLDSIREQGIKTVVLLGDYSDDGQIESIDRVARILSQYEKDYGLSFFVIPGNHDYFGPCGKHQSTRFAVNPAQTLLVTSDPETATTEAQSAVLTDKMFCPGAVDALEPMKTFGLTKRAEYVHWETPFGLDDELSKRSYLAQSQDGEATHQLTDCSYLVEPADGLWLLMLDANVFEPRNGDWNITQKRAFLDSSDAGWNSLLRNKKYLLDWIRDVTERAKADNKSLLVFSHYPAMDPFSDEQDGYEKLFGATEIKRRKPNPKVAKALLDVGVTTHFGGHMHVNSTQQLSLGTTTFTNIAVPSPVAFPPAYSIVEPTLNSVDVHNVPLNALPVDDALMQFYKEEETVSANGALSPALNANTYGEFLYLRLYSRVEHRYIKKNWPTDIASALGQTNTLDLLYLLMASDNSDATHLLKPIDASSDKTILAALNSLLATNSLHAEAFSHQPMMELLVDWYCLRDASAMAKPYISDQKLQHYRFLSTHFGDTALPKPTNHQTFFRILLGLLQPPLNTLQRV